MDTASTITTKQIVNQIEGNFKFKILGHKDFLNTVVEVYDQAEGIWIKPVFNKAKRISEDLVFELKDKLDYSEVKFNTDLPVIRVASDAEYDAFFDKYYNSI